MVWYTNICGSGHVVELGRTKRETNEDRDEDCVEEGFQLVRVKFDRNGEGRHGTCRFGESCINI